MSVVLILLLYYVASVSSDGTYSGLLVDLRKLVIVVFFLVSVFNLLDSNQRSWVFAYLQKYKPYSFFLFAIHMFLFTIVQRALLKLGIEDHLHNKFNALLFCVFSMLIVLVMALSMGKFIKSKWSRFFFFITGR
jgi:hypothetical protein